MAHPSSLSRYIEANPDTFEQLRNNRTAGCVNACLDATEGVVDFAKHGVVGGILSSQTDNKQAQSSDVVRMLTTTLGKVLQERNAPPGIDYMSIDVEGAEERVLAGIDLKQYRFKCITIKRPSAPVRSLLRDNAYAW